MKIKCLLHLIGLGVALVSAVSDARAQGSNIGQWNFDNGNLDAVAGQPLEYLGGTNGLTAAGTSFGTTTSFGIPNINGVPAHVMHVPGDLNGGIGYLMRHGIAANGGGTRVNQFTLLFDIFWETTGPAAASFVNFESGNAGDGDLFFRATDGGFGQGGGDGFSGNTVMMAGRWHRVIFACDMAANPPVVTKFLDGVKHADQLSGNSLDNARRSMPVAGAVICGDGDADERRACYLSSVQVRAGKMSDAEMAAMGGPSASKIPLPPPPVRLVINEWLANNVSGIVDPADGQHDDWFEIYNPGTNVVDLGGLYLTDWNSNDFRFAIPIGYEIPAGGYVRVWADGEPGQTTPTSLHTTFTLAAGGGNIGLYAADGTAIDAISYGPQTPDVSEGRFPDGAANRYFLTPTPLAANGPGPVGPGCGPLHIQMLTGNTVVVWPVACQLQFKDSLDDPIWSNAGAPGGGEVVLPITPGTRFFRTVGPDGACSPNVVGYVNLSLQSDAAGTRGTIVANPLNGTNNSLNTILPLPEAYDGTVIFRFDAVSQNFRDAVTFITGVGWFTPDPDPNVLNIDPGEGFFIFPMGPNPLSVTFVGEVPQGTLVNPLPPANLVSFRSSIAPLSGQLGGALGFQAEDGDNVYVFDVATQNYKVFQYFDGYGWFSENADDPGPAGPLIPVATGFKVQKSSTAVRTAWVQTNVVTDCHPPCPPPVFTSGCVAVGFPCGTPWSWPAATALDRCCGSNATITVRSITTNGHCPQMLERILVATDCRGQTSVCTQRVALVDFTPPVFTTHCTTNHYDVGTHDNFNGPEAASPSAGLQAWLMSPTNIGCVKGFDDCRLNCFFAHTFSNLPPCITSATLTVRLKSCGDLCDTDTLGFYFINASGTVAPGWSSLIGTSAGLLGGESWCNFTAGYTFTFDLAHLPAGGGNTDLLATMSALGYLDFITQDDTAVDFIQLDVVSCCCGTNRTVECGTAWTFETPTAIDNCCSNVTIIPLSTVTNVLGDCRQTIIRTWQASDCCSNTAICLEVINVVDTTPPVLTDCVTNHYDVGTHDNFNGPEAASPSAGLQAWLMSPTNIGCVKGFDDCRLNCFFAHTFSNLPPCITSATLTVRLKSCGDLCDTDTLGFYFINASGTVAPGWSSLIGTSAGLLGESWCNFAAGHTFTFDLAHLPAGGGNTDLLATMSTLGYLDFITQDDTAVDYITLDVVSCCCGSTRIVECGTPWTFQPPTAFDACCGTNVTITSVVFGSGNACSNVNTVIWTVTDCCSNSITCTQRVVVVDTTPPVVTCPADKTVECGSHWAFDRPTAYDACCGTNVSITPLYVIPGTNICPWTFTQVWSVSDCCSNTVLCQQTVTVMDTTRPILHCPEIIKVPTCSNSAPVYYHVVATDNCDAHVQVVCTPPAPGPFPLGTTIITCTATDDCGNTTTCSFPIVVYPAPNFWQSFPAGLADCYANRFEPASPGLCLQGAYPGACWKWFDDPKVNCFLGHSWNLPPGTYLDGTLTLRMKDYYCQGNSVNDTINLGLQNCSTPTWAWGRPLANLGTDLGLPSTSPWCNIPGWGPVFVLDLNDLPPVGTGKSVIGEINSPAGAPWTRRLDMLVQDDTRVDFAWLRLLRCPPQHIIGGFETRLTNAHLVHGPGTWTLAKDPASTNGFAAEFELGQANGARLNFENLSFANASNGVLRLLVAKGWGLTPDTLDRQELVSYWNSNDFCRLRFGQPLPGVSNVVVRTFSNGVVIASNTVPATAGAELARFSSATVLRNISVGKGGQVTCAMWDNWERVITVTPRPALGVDPVVVWPLTAVALAADGFEEITLGQPEVGVNRTVEPTDGQHDDIVDPEDGQWDDWGFAIVSGDAIARAEGGQLTLSALDATQPGPMSLKVCPGCAGEGTNGGHGTNEFRATIQTSFGQFSPIPSNASLSLVSIVDPADGQHDDWFTVNFSIMEATRWGLSVARTNASLPLRYVQLWNSNDVRVANVPNPVSVSVSELPSVYWPSTTWFVDADICHRLLWNAPVTVWIDGTPYQATELRFLTGGPGDDKRTLKGLRVETTGADAAVLSSLETGPKKYTLATPVVNGGDIVIRANSLGGVVQATTNIGSTTNSWTTVPTVAGEVRVSTTNAPVRFFRVKGN